MFEAAIESTLQALFDSTEPLPLGALHRMVVFSDLHLGDGGPRDDFAPNAEMMHAVLRDHYLAGGFALVLNGDIEELQRFRWDAIHAQWASLYGLCEDFRAGPGFWKIVGNHDEGLVRRERAGVDRDLRDALRLSFDGNTLFLFHGHQATIFFERFNDVSGFFLKYVANTLRIRNYPVNIESQKKYRTEHRVYAFSSTRKIVSVIGHTHRPLFESLSKIDGIRFRIERLCRDYPAASPPARAAIEEAIRSSKAELERLWESDREEALRSSLYNDQICIPSLFNSGSAIGKRGVTAIEIADGSIALVHWFHGTRSSHHLTDEGSAAERLGETDFYRTVLKQDLLDYVFTRIRLLA